MTNKISRQYGYPANHCDVGSNTAIIHGRFYPGVTEWPLEMSPIQHAEDHIDLLFSCKVKDTVGIWGFHPIVDTPKRFGVNAAPDPGTTQNAWGNTKRTEASQPRRERLRALPAPCALASPTASQQYTVHTHLY